MGKVLDLIKNEEVISFSQGIGSINKNTMGDRLFPDLKTKNLKATYYQLTDGQQLPTMATVHAFDTEAKIGKRPTLEKITVEKLLIKEKINLSEKENEYLENGVSEADDIIRFVFNDFGRLAESVKTRVEVAKMELLSTGKITVKENKLNYSIDFGLANDHKFSKNWSADTADILEDIRLMVKAAKDKGQTVNRCVTTTPVFLAMAKNKAIQRLIFSTAGEGTYTDITRLNILLQSIFGFSIEINDELYRYDAGSSMKTEYYIPRNKFILYSSLPNGTAGACIWGVTPEERQQGIWTQKSSQQFITLTGWATEDPVVEWFKATGLAVPIMPNRDGHVVADITTA